MQFCLMLSDHPYFAGMSDNERFAHDHALAQSDQTERFFHPIDSPWPLYSITIHQYTGDKNPIFTRDRSPGIKISTNVKLHADCWWQKTDEWDTFPYGLIPVLIKLLENVTKSVSGEESL